MENYEQLLNSLEKSIKKDKSELDRIKGLMAEVETMRESQLDIIESEYSACTGLSLNDHQKLKMRIWIITLGLEVVLKSIEIYCNQYMVYDDNKDCTYFTRGFSIIGGIARNINQQEYSERGE